MSYLFRPHRTDGAADVAGDVGGQDHRVLAAAAEAHGAVQVDGKMVDRPVLLKAQGILDRSAN